MLIFILHNLNLISNYELKFQIKRNIKIYKLITNNFILIWILKHGLNKRQLKLSS